MLDHKEVALRFLRSAAAGRAQEAKGRYVAPDCVHHNVYFPAGMDALAAAMDEAARRKPDKVLDIQRVIAEGDLVAIHSHVRQDPEDRGAAVMHIFRFEDGKIAEFWDFGQEVPAETPNKDGMF